MLLATMGALALLTGSASAAPVGDVWSGLSTPLHIIAGVLTCGGRGCARIIANSVMIVAAICTRVICSAAYESPGTTTLLAVMLIAGIVHFGSVRLAVEAAIKVGRRICELSVSDQGTLKAKFTEYINKSPNAARVLGALGFADAPTAARTLSFAFSGWVCRSDIVSAIRGMVPVLVTSSGTRQSGSIGLLMTIAWAVAYLYVSVFLWWDSRPNIPRIVRLATRALAVVGAIGLASSACGFIAANRGVVSAVLGEGEFVHMIMPGTSYSAYASELHSLLQTCPVPSQTLNATGL